MQKDFRGDFFRRLGQGVNMKFDMDTIKEYIKSPVVLEVVLEE
jgi:hypothetical protein